MEQGGEASVFEVEVGPTEDSMEVEAAEDSVEEEEEEAGAGSEAGAGADHSFSGNFNKTFLLIIVSPACNENRALLDGLLNKFLYNQLLVFFSPHQSRSTMKT